MRERALVHVAGPAGAGKTMFIERLLDAGVALAICVRAERDAKLKKAQESAPKAHAELQRYRQAGASAVALYHFAEPDTDAFFTTDFMQDYSEAVFIEGDRPIDHVDLSVFVARAEAGRSLFRRVTRDAARDQAGIDQLARALENPEALIGILDGPGEPAMALALQESYAMDALRRSMTSRLGELRRGPAAGATERWSLQEGYAGIERAQLVVVNVRSDAERRAAESLVEEVARIRKDEEIYRDVVGFRGNKLPVTVVVADLAVPKDAGLKKAAARVKRSTRRRSR